MKNKLNKNFWNKHGHVVIIYVFLVALMLLVSVFSRDFFTIGNFKNLLRTSFPLLMVALGQTLIILTGGIDLSLGGIVALAQCSLCYDYEYRISCWIYFTADRSSSPGIGLRCFKRSAGNKRKSGSYYRNHCNNSNF